MRQNARENYKRKKKAIRKINNWRYKDFLREVALSASIKKNHFLRIKH